MGKTVQDLITFLLTATLVVLFLSDCNVKPLPSVSLPPSLPRSMKEYELYSWKSGAAWRFTLINGTNRLKTVAEITSSESVIEGDWIKITVEGVSDLESVLNRLPSGTQVFWQGAHHPGVDSHILKVALRVPPERLVREIRARCAELDIRLEVDR